MIPTIQIEGVSKRFRLSSEGATSLKERVIHARRNTTEEFWALRDVSLEVHDGETVGLLGHNGSGKSTLLKCVAGTLRPNGGSILVRGRVAALLELGAGFHGDLTGRENVYLNASILGFKAAEVDRIFDEIVAFSELEPFIDQPVKHYSSGMYARLGFAVAVNVDPDILLIDEVLSVGDEAFQLKCIERIRRFRREGRTILLVTHAADLVRQLCDRAAVLDHGQLIHYGKPNDAVRAFRQTLRQGGHEESEDAHGDAAPAQHDVVLQPPVFEFPENRGYLFSGEPLEIRLGYTSTTEVVGCIFAITIYDQNGQVVVSTNSDLLGEPTEGLPPTGEVVWSFEQVPYLDGRYLVSFSAHDKQGRVSDQRDEDWITVQSHGRLTGRVLTPISARVVATGSATARS